MINDYSSFGPAYRNFKVREGVFVPEPAMDFPGDNPHTRMTPIRGKTKDIQFDETYPYLDQSLKFKIWHILIYLTTWLVVFPVNRLRYGIKIEGRDKIRKNRKLFANGLMTVCNHVHRWDMLCVLQAMRYRKAWIPMYAQAFNGKDGFLMKHIGGIAIPEISVERFEDYSGKMTLRLAPFVHMQAAQFAQKEGISLNQYINNAVPKNSTMNIPTKPIPATSPTDPKAPVVDAMSTPAIAINAADAMIEPTNCAIKYTGKSDVGNFLPAHKPIVTAGLK